MASLAGSKGGIPDAMKKKIKELRKKRLGDIEILTSVIGIGLNRWKLKDESQGEINHHNGFRTLAVDIRIAEASTTDGEYLIERRTHERRDYVHARLTKDNMKIFDTTYENGEINVTRNPLYFPFARLLDRIEEYCKKEEHIESLARAYAELNSRLSKIKEARKTLAELLD